MFERHDLQPDKAWCIETEPSTVKLSLEDEYESGLVHFTPDEADELANTLHEYARFVRSQQPVDAPPPTEP